jgi:hypothetical protein
MKTRAAILPAAGEVSAVQSWAAQRCKTVHFGVCKNALRAIMVADWPGHFVEINGEIRRGVERELQSGLYVFRGVPHRARRSIECSEETTAEGWRAR